MSTDELEICRDFFERAYREKLGIAFSSSIAEIGQGRRPVWRTVSDHDLTTRLEPQDSGAAGLLLDPEIGLLLYILPFHAKTSLHKQIVRALGLRSQLSIEKNYGGSNKSDSRGAWRVAVHWLVAAKESEKWTTQIEKIRRESAFSEELALDAIFLTDEGDRRTQIARYGFPRLLITTREVFKKQRIEEMAVWLSANDLVKEALMDFGAQFHKPEQRELASEVVDALKGFERVGTNGVSAMKGSSTPRRIRKIHIRDFRNLRDVRFDFGVPAVSTSVIHGPNGTGKSSLCEAISIALFRSSFRYKWFADNKREKDVTVHDRVREYVGRYLTPLNDPKAEPQIAIDEQPLTPLQLLSADQTDEVDFGISGTILTQDTSLEFARMDSAELGALVLRGYSDLADHVEDFTESRANQANEARQRFLRLLGVSASITKIDTAYARIARREIDQSLPSFPRPLVSWLDTVTKHTGDGGGLVRRWRSWGDDASRSDIALQLAALSDRPSELTREIGQWLQKFNELVLASKEVLEIIEINVEPIREDIEQAAALLKAWGQWLEGQNALSPAPSPEVVNLTEDVKRLQATQQDLVKRGHEVSAHLEHLTKVEAFVRESWAALHADSCPTCGADHAGRGGILSVVETLRTQTAAERE